MPNEAKYFMGDVYAGDVGFGFLVSDRRDGAVETTIDERTARSIVGASGGNPNSTISPANLFEISQDEFEFTRETEISVLGFPEGLTVWQVKRS